MQVLEMEEVESLVGRKKLSSHGQKKENGLTVMSLALRRDFVTYIVGVAFLLLLLLYVATKGSAKEVSSQDVEVKVPAPVTPNIDNITALPEPAPVATPTASPTIRPTSTPRIEVPPTKPTLNDAEKTDKNFYSKVAAFDPLMDPPMPDEETANKLAQKWGKWSFWDGSEATRPAYDYLAKYPNNDCPGSEFPDDAWQVDAVFVNHYLNDADKLISRAMEAIYAEYGHPREGLEPEQLTQRMQQFQWEKIDMADATQPPPKYLKRGDRGNGGWTTKRSERGLVRRLLHAMMTSDTFTVVMGGHSAAAGEGNHFRQSYMMQFHKVMAPIFARLGVKLITRNLAMGGMGTLHSAMGSASIYGDEIDLLIWDSGMTEGRDLPAVDLFLRQGLIGGKRVPVIWSSGIQFDLLKNFHELADADIGEFGLATDLLPEVQSHDQAAMISWAARYMKCSDDARDLCKEEPRYCTRCWVDRGDGIVPDIPQADKPNGQVSWHPGWRSHQLVGRNLAMGVLFSLRSAVNIWTEHVAAGPPLADEFWHVTNYYDNIRTKVMEIPKSTGPCFQYEGRLPARICITPMKALTHYTPRANPEKTGINVYLKPTEDGHIPTNQRKNLFEGPDPPNPCFTIPEGEIDVYAIVTGRRRLGEKVAWESITNESISVNQPPNVYQTSNRSLEGDIIPGKGWELIWEPPGYCDGTYNSICNRATECMLQGQQAARGAIVGNEFSGWLILTLNGVKEGIIILKLHTWYYENENTITQGWVSVNNEARHLRERSQQKLNRDFDEEVGEVFERQLLDRSLAIRSTDTPPLPDTMIFEYAIDGQVYSLARDEFLAKKHQLQRVVETLTILDDPDFTAEPKDVEIAIRMRGCGRDCTFGLSHVYWA